MQARVVRPLRGAQWLASGWRLFTAAPLGWLAVVFAYWVSMLLVSLLPAGALVAPLLVPAFSVGFMAAGRAAARGAPVELAQLYEGFRQAPGPQLALGVLYLACLAAVLGLTALLDDGALSRLMVSGSAPGDEEQASALRSGLVAAMLLYLPVMMLFWFAPVLAAWHAVGIVKALFFSFFACLMNWRAFLVYGALTVLLPALVLLGLAQALGAVVLRAIMLPLIILALPTLLGSFYASYRDVFAEEAA
jgi:hypothetical protein